LETDEDNKNCSGIVTCDKCQVSLCINCSKPFHIQFLVLQSYDRRLWSKGKMKNGVREEVSGIASHDGQKWSWQQKPSKKRHRKLT
jgi:hypothetical protein